MTTFSGPRNAGPRLSRQALVVGAASAFASIAIPRFPAGAAEFEYKVGHDLAADHPMNLRLTEMAANVARESNGRLTITVFPNSALGGDTAMIAQVRSGAIQFHMAVDTILGSVVPATAIEAVGYAFREYKDVWAALDGELGAYVRGQLATAGLYGFDKVWDLGFHQMFNNLRPINAPADFAGMKLRVPVSPQMIALIKALGASPVGINWNEVYPALQTHIADGLDDPIASIDSAKLYEVTKYLSMTNHMWDGYWFIANGAAWRALPKDLRDIVNRNADAAAVAERADLMKLNASLADKMKSKGMLLNTPPDLAPFRAKLRADGYYAAMKAQYGPTGWALLEKYTGPLG